MFRALCPHHQEVKIILVLYSIWYHHTLYVAVPCTGSERTKIIKITKITKIRLESSLNLCTGRPPTGVMIPDAV